MVVLRGPGNCKCSFSFSIQLEPFMTSFLTGLRVSPAEPARVAAPNQNSPKDIHHSPCLFAC